MMCLVCYFRVISFVCLITVCLWCVKGVCVGVCIYGYVYVYVCIYNRVYEESSLWLEKVGVCYGNFSSFCEVFVYKMCVVCIIC